MSVGSTSVDADVIALQEVIGPGLTGPGQAEILGATLGMGWVMAPARRLRGHLFGNVVLSRFPITQHLEQDLTWKTCEPRRLQRVQRPLRLQCTHKPGVARPRPRARIRAWDAGDRPLRQR